MTSESTPAQLATSIDRREWVERVLTGTQRIDRIRRVRERTILTFLFLAALISIATTIGIIYTLGIETIRFFQRVSIVDFLTDTQWTPPLYREAFRHLATAHGDHSGLGHRDAHRPTDRAPLGDRAR
jgi:hypothetical protein